MSFSVNRYKIYISQITILISFWMISITNTQAADIWPPYRKTNDVEKCLITKNSQGPSDWIGYYYNACAEATGESSFYLPKIMVRRQTCNFAACWVQSKALKWGGDCVIWPGGYAYPPDRYCARMAVEGDHGYTAGVYLDGNGKTQPDPTYKTSDGAVINLSLPKLCAYHDPSGAETALADPIDINPYYGPYHKTDKTHPLANLIITCVQNNLPISSAIKSFVTITGANKLGDGFADTLTAILAPTEFLVKFFLNDIKKWLVMNSLVYESLGCVNIPLAQGPERYCAFLKPSISKPQIQTICQTTNDGTIQNSTIANPCVNSTLVNNLINNSIRISYDQAIPLCVVSSIYDSTQDPYKTSNCVKIAYDSATGTKSPSLVRNILNKQDIIKKCLQFPPNNSELPCVQTMLPQSSFRIIYGIQTNPTNSQRINGFASEILDCNDGRYAAGQFCQTVWGINNGSYGDLALNFPAFESLYDNTRVLNTQTTLYDPTGNQKTFQAKIVRQSTTINTNQGDISQQPNQICVYDTTATTKLIGCANRTDGPPQPTVSMANTSGYYNPAITLKITSGNNVSQGVISALNMYQSTNYPVTINIAGFDYSSYVTNNNYDLMPFNNNISPATPPPNTIYGIYKPATPPPFDANSNRNNNNSLYTSGLEYLNGKYSLGGTQICLTGFKMAGCSQNANQCVLASLNNADLVDCSILQRYSNKTYDSISPGVQKCPSSTKNCIYNIDTIPYKNGRGSLAINKCTIGAIDVFCYNGASNLCTVTLAPNQRIEPKYSGPGTETLAANESFQVVSTRDANGNLKVNYDNRISTIRDKTEIENSLCVLIPQPVCGAINQSQGSSASNGYATWPATDVGLKATGKCIGGYNSAKPVTRDCVISFKANANSPQVQFDSVDNGNICQQNLIAVSLASAGKWPDNLKFSKDDIVKSNNRDGTITYKQQFTVDYTVNDLTRGLADRETRFDDGEFVVDIAIDIPNGTKVDYIRPVNFDHNIINLVIIRDFVDYIDNKYQVFSGKNIDSDPTRLNYIYAYYHENSDLKSDIISMYSDNGKFPAGRNILRFMMDQYSIYDYNRNVISGTSDKIKYSGNPNINGQRIKITYEWSATY